jgi:hypothetical protein
MHSFAQARDGRQGRSIDHPLRHATQRNMYLIDDVRHRDGGIA